MKFWSIIWHLIRFQPLLYLLNGILSGIMFYVFPLATGLVISEFFDILERKGQISQEWTIIALLVAIAVVRMPVMASAGGIEMTLQSYIDTLLRKNLFQYILKLSKIHTLPSSSGEAISRFRDDVHAVANFLSWTCDPLGQALITGVALVIMIRINAFITLAIFIPMFIILLPINIASKRIQKYHKASQEAVGKVTGFLGDVFGAALSIKIMGSEMHAIEHLDDLNNKRVKATMKDLLASNILSSLSLNVANLGIALMLLLGAQAMRAGTFSVADFVLFTLYLSWVTQIADLFNDISIRYRQVKVSWERLKGLLPEVLEGTLVQHGSVYLRGSFPTTFSESFVDPSPLSELKVVGLSYQYPGSTRGISDVSLHLKRGSLTVITGGIGSGKTTLLRVLLGLLPKDSGDIYWNDVKIDHADDFFAPPHSSYTSQVPRLFSDSLKDNVLLGMPEDDEHLASVLHTAILEKDIETLEQGLNTTVGPRGKKLSGGQIQRVAMARMLAPTADLLLIDDPSALDVETEQLLWQRLFAKKDVTYLVVSHRRAVLSQADHIIVLNKGQVVQEGNWRDLLGKSEFIDHIVED